MTHPVSYTDPGYFDHLYASDPDPWHFATSEYERDKYAATIAALPSARYRRCFEVGCSIGVLTRALAERCDTILGVDIADNALQQARTRCNDRPGVTFARMVVPNEWPPGRFDLLLFSEVLYYLGLEGITEAAHRTTSTLAPGGHIILVNWRGPTDGACTGEEAASRYIEASGLEPLDVIRAEKYRLDVLTTSK